MANLNIKNFDDDLHMALKMKAAQEKTTIQKLVILAIEKFISGRVVRKGG